MRELGYFVQYLTLLVKEFRSQYRLMTRVSEEILPHVFDDIAIIQSNIQGLFADMIATRTLYGPTVHHKTRQQGLAWISQ